MESEGGLFPADFVQDGSLSRVERHDAVRIHQTYPYLFQISLKSRPA